MEFDNTYELLQKILGKVNELEERVQRLETKRRDSLPPVDKKYSDRDDLYIEARQYVIEAGYASASLLQRRLSIGYARAARLINMLEEDGVVGPSQGAQPREVLIDFPSDPNDNKDDNEIENLKY